MPTPFYLTGFEHGVASLNGDQLFSTALANASIVTSPVRNGARALRVNPTAAVGQAGLYNVSAAVIVARFALRLAALPSADTWLWTFHNTSDQNACLCYRQSTGAFCWGGDSALTAGSDWNLGTVAVDTWYVFDVRVDRTGTTVNWKAKADADASFADQSDVTIAGGLTGVVYAGNPDNVKTFDCYYDDVLISTTSADWPLGDGKVIGISPAADGAHNAGTTIFIDGDTKTSPNFTNSTTTAWTFLDNVPFTTARSTTDNVSCEVHSSGAYMEIAPGAALVGEEANGVRALLAYSSVTSTANNGSATIIRNSAGTETTVRGSFPASGVDYSESTNFFSGQVAAKPAAGWTKTEIEALRWRIGRASNSTDVSPRPTWQSLMLEVDYPIVAAGAAPSRLLGLLGVGV